jgi:hypothetical protein
VIEHVGQVNAMLAALLARAAPVAVTERELTIAFPAGADFLKRKAEQDDHRRVAAEAVRAVTGAAPALRFRLLREDEPNEGPETAPVLSGEELVRRFQEEFDAEEILGDHDQDEAR